MIFIANTGLDIRISILSPWGKKTSCLQLILPLLTNVTDLLQENSLALYNILLTELRWNHI